jgi:ParB family chromosome partitioning protein
MTVRERPTGLGRGLASLIPQRATPLGVVDVPIDRVSSNPYQPRTRVDEAELDALAASIRAHGVLQPILVTQTLDGYRLVAGERRLRGARLAGLDRIPAIVRQVAEREQLELALVENIQRADLGPVEEARAYRQLIDEFGLTQEEVASRVGRARSSIANTLRLLELADSVVASLEAGGISEGHGRALGGLDAAGQERLLPLVVGRALSVRQTEDLVRRIRDGVASEAAPNGPAEATASPRSAEWERVEGELRTALGTKVTLARSRRGGRIVIEYYSDEELGRLYDRLIGGGA